MKLIKSQQLFALVVGLLLQTIFATAQEGGLKGKNLVEMGYGQVDILNNKYQLMANNSQSYYTLADMEGRGVIDSSYKIIKAINTADYLISNRESFRILDGDLNLIYTNNQYDGYTFIDMPAPYITVKKGNKYGLIDYSGKQSISFHENIRYLKDSVFLVTDSTYNYLVNAKGKVIREFKETFLVGLGDGLLAVSKQGHKTGVINERGDTIIPFEYVNCDNLAGKYIAADNKNDTHIYLPTGKKLVSTAIKQHLLLENNILELRDQFYTSFINLTNDHYVQGNYKYLSFISDSTAIVRKNNLYGLIDRDGKILLPLEYTAVALQYKDELYMPSQWDDLGFVYYYNGITPSTQEYRLHALYENNIGYGCIVEIHRFNCNNSNILWKKKDWQVFNSRGIAISPPLDSVDFPAGKGSRQSFFIAYKQGKSGFFELNHKVYEPPVFEEVKRLNNSGLQIKKKGKYAIQVFPKEEYYTDINNYSDEETPYYYPIFSVNKNGRLHLDFTIDSIKTNKNIAPVIIKQNGYWQLYTSLISENELYNPPKPRQNPAIFEDISYLENTGVLMARIKNKIGIIDQEMNITVPIAYDSIAVPERLPRGYYNDFNMGIFNLKDSVGWFILTKLRKVFPSQANDEPATIMNEKIVFKQQGKYGLADLEGNILIAPTYQNIRNNRNEAFVQQNNRWGCADYKNKAILPCEYENLINRYADFYIAQQNSKCGVVSKDNKVLVPFLYDAILWIGDDNLEVQIGKKYGVINTKNEVILPIDYDSIHYKVDIREVYHQRNISRLDYATQIDNSQIDSTYFIIKNNGKWGIINAQKQLIIPLEYDEINYWNNAGLIYVRKGQKWGLLNHRNVTIILTEYDAFEFDFFHKYLLLRKDGKVGMVDWNHQLLVPFEYDRAEEQGGFIPSDWINFYKGKKVFVYTKQGEFLHTYN